MATTHETPPRGTSPRLGWVRRPLPDIHLPVVRFARSGDNAVLSGVSGGLGERFGIEPTVVRIAFVVLSVAGAAGVVLYLIAWAFSLDPGDPRAPVRDASTEQSIAFGAIVLGVVIVCRSAGLWLGDAIGIPVVIAAVGAGIIYVGAGQGRKMRRTPSLFRRELPTGRPSLLHLAVGGVLVVGGVVWFLTISGSFRGILSVLIPVAVTAAGLAVVFGPWVYRLANQLGDERRDRVRSEERAELAAHLHDSVLQTLALIQRNATDPRKMSSLARRQERELRQWLYGEPDAGTDKLETAMQAMAASVEESHEVPIEVVVVGDCTLDDKTRAVVLACREAVTNAAVHSGADEVSVYVECDASTIEAFVRDRGNGFEPGAVGSGRRGIADSIRGRVERHGGSVTITSAADEGCEVHITMPRPEQPT